MDKIEFVKNWIKELRSGRYSECRDGILYSGGDRYCPFGIATIVACKMGIIKSFTDGQDYTSVSCGDWFTEIFGTCDPYVGNSGYRLGYLYDVQRYTFDMVADAIEEKI